MDAFARTVDATSVNTLASGVAHELSSPLFAISGRADLLLQHPDGHLATDAAREVVAGISDDARKVAQTVREL